jgi:hypothetical protein
MSIIPAKSLPRIAYVGGDSLTNSHGTGLMFSRHFSNYPHSKIIDIHYHSSAKKHLFRHIALKPHDLRYHPWHESAWSGRINRCIRGEPAGKGMSLLYKHMVFDDMKIDWKKFGGPPDLIYSTCHTWRDFAFLHHVYRNLDKKVPIVQHFLDLSFQEYNTIVALFRELQPAMAAIWGLTKQINNAVSSFSFIRPTPVHALHQPLDRKFKREHRALSKDFSALLIGNIWSGNAYLAMCEIWSRCQEYIPDLPAVTWVGHPRRFTVLNEYLPKRDLQRTKHLVKDGGFLSDAGLKERIAAADVGIIAFSGKRADRPDYERYSLPSRIGDYCVRGLPVVVITKEDTAPFDFVKRTGIGIVIDPTEPKRAAEELSLFLFDKERRRQAGEKARAYAEANLDVKLYQNVLYPTLVELAKYKLPMEYINKYLT